MQKVAALLDGLHQLAVIQPADIPVRPQILTRLAVDVVIATCRRLLRLCGLLGSLAALALGACRLHRLPHLPLNLSAHAALLEQDLALLHGARKLLIIQPSDVPVGTQVLPPGSIVAGLLLLLLLLLRLPVRPVGELLPDLVHAPRRQRFGQVVLTRLKLQQLALQLLDAHRAVLLRPYGCWGHYRPCQQGKRGVGNDPVAQHHESLSLEYACRYRRLAAHHAQHRDKTEMNPA